jgi:predicted metal-dependent hydrolase
MGDDGDMTGPRQPRNTRPRDALGRPMPYGSVGVGREPDGVVRTPEQVLSEAQRLFDAGMPFHAHEVLEGGWRAAPAGERELWRGLAQLAVGSTHAARGNRRGAVALLSRGAAALERYAGTSPYGLDVGALLSWARQAERLSAHAPVTLHSPPLHRSS